MNEFLILLITTLLFVLFIYIYYYQHMLKRLNLQKIDILRYKILEYNFTDKRIDRLINSKKLWNFVLGIQKTIDLETEQFLNTLKREKINIDDQNSSKTHFNSTFGSEILKLIKSNQTNKNEKEFINNFIELQLKILSIKHPLKYRFIIIKKIFSDRVANDIIMLLFIGYVEIMTRFRKQFRDYSWRVGKYLFTAEVKRSQLVNSMIIPEEKINILQSIKSINLIGC